MLERAFLRSSRPLTALTTSKDFLEKSSIQNLSSLQEYSPNYIYNCFFCPWTCYHSKCAWHWALYLSTHISPLLLGHPLFDCSENHLLTYSHICFQDTGTSFLCPVPVGVPGVRYSTAVEDITQDCTGQKAEVLTIQVLFFTRNI